MYLEPPGPLSGLMIYRMGLLELGKMIILLVVAYYSERMQFKISN